MTKENAVNIIWEYMHMGHTVKVANCIFILGSNDPRVAKHAAALYHSGLAPIVAISGDGTKHETALLRDPHGGRKEAEILKAICIEEGVPEHVIITEDEANNTGQNFEFITPLLQAAGIKTDTVIAVQKPYMERRTYATGKVWWPDTELIISAPTGTFNEYVQGVFDPDTIINIMMGDLERIKEYPALGYQIYQAIPELVWEAFLYLTAEGYTKHLLKK